MTARSDFVFQAFNVGAFRYLVKPFDDEKFAEVFDRKIILHTMDADIEYYRTQWKMWSGIFE